MPTIKFIQSPDFQPYKMKLHVLVVLSLFSIFSICCKCSNILILLPFSPQSQKIAFDVLVEELSTRNHNITYVTMFPPSKEISGVKTVLMNPRLIQFFDNITSSMFNTSVSFSLTAIPKIGNIIYDLCDLILTDENLQNFVKSSKSAGYEVIIANAMIHECYLPVAHQIGAPLVLLSPPVLFPTLAWNLNIPNPLSCIPMMILSYNSTMSFFQRLRNFSVATVWHVVYSYVVAPIAESSVRKHLPHAPTTVEIVRNASFILVNSHFSMDGPRPSMPNMVEVGCIHCHEGKPLPKDLKNFVDASDDGFIVFSLGSIIKGNYMSPSFVRVFVNAFSQIKQKVVWKYEKHLDGLSSNVLLQKWLPQQDLMAHPKCKLAITHGGLLSLQEVAYHSVPLLGVPLGIDRIKNINDAVRMGFAMSLDDWDNLTTTSLINRINELIYNPKYKQAAEKLSTLMKDRPEHPVKTAAYWVEYVIRHKGAFHLTSAAKHLYTFQYYLLDVFAFILTISLISIFVFVKCIKFTCKCCFSKKNSKSKSKQKKH